MRIVDSEIAMASKHEQYVRDTVVESLRVWDNRNESVQNAISSLQAATAEISEQAKALFASQNEDLNKLVGDTLNDNLTPQDQQKIQLVQDLFQMLTGKKLKFAIPQKLELNSPKLTMIPLNGQLGQGQGRVGWGIAFNHHESHVETEQLRFVAAGQVKTADGRQIDFKLDYDIRREYRSESNISLRAGDAAIDPLVVNFGGLPAGLTTRKYGFDLDSDGDQEQISFVGQGSGFLALDKNGDGTINNGSELFGPESGQGFAELANYDGDGNGWIDENDPIYDKLSIWVKDENGSDHLFALGQKGIGAIYLGNVATDFSYKNQTNQLQGQAKQSGIFLRENGTAGVIQQIDLAV